MRAFWLVLLLFVTTRAQVEWIIEDLDNDDDHVIEKPENPQFGRYRLCLNMIVKNEEHVIARALASALPHVDAAVIADTGSSDRTQEIIRAHNAPEKPILLLQHEWQNFEYNRNEALRAAKPHCSYVLFLDADDTLVVNDGVSLATMQLQDVNEVTVAYGELRYGRDAIVYTTGDCRWIGVVHEYMECLPRSLSSNSALLHPPVRSVLKGVEIHIVGGGARSKDPEKYLNDTNVLSKALALPDCGPHGMPDPCTRKELKTRYTFYLAQSYRDAGYQADALLWYLVRANMTEGYRDEIYISWVNVGRLRARLEPENKQEIMQAYLNAHNTDRERYEALYEIAQAHRMQSDYFHCMAVARFALSFIVPRTTGLFVTKWITEWGLNDELSICAYYYGDMRTSYKQSHFILEKFGKTLDPGTLARIKANRQFAMDRGGHQVEYF